MITAGQVKAARSLVGWNQDRLAAASEVAISTIRRMEGKEGPIGGYAENVWKIQRALEAAGIAFIDEGSEGGVGVRLAKGDRPPARG